MIRPAQDGYELVHDAAGHASEVMLRLLTGQGLLQLLRCCSCQLLQEGEGRDLQSSGAGHAPAQGDRTDDGGIEGWDIPWTEEVCLLVGCLTSQQQASASQGRICSDKFTCCHTEIEVADQTFYLTQSQYTDTGPTSRSADPISPGAWQGSHWSANF